METSNKTNQSREREDSLVAKRENINRSEATRTEVSTVFQTRENQEKVEFSMETLVERLCDELLAKGRQIRKIRKDIQNYEEDLASREIKNQDYINEINKRILTLKEKEGELRLERQEIIDKINSLDSKEVEENNIEKKLKEIDEEIEDIFQIIKSAKEDNLYLLVGLYNKLSVLSKEKADLLKQKQLNLVPEKNDENTHLKEGNSLVNNPADSLEKKIDLLQEAVAKNQTINNEEFDKIKNSLEELKKINETSGEKGLGERILNLEKKIRELEDKVIKMQEIPEHSSHSTNHKEIVKKNNTASKITKGIRNWITKTFHPDSLIYKHWSIHEDEKHHSKGETKSHEENITHETKTEEKVTTEKMSSKERFDKYLETVAKLKSKGIKEGTPHFLIGIRAAGFSDFIKPEDSSKVSSDKKSTEKAKPALKKAA